MKPPYFILAIALCLQGCSNEASHLPSPIELPFMAASSLIENKRYQTKHSAVKNYVRTYYDALKQEIVHGEGAHLEVLLDKASVKKADRSGARKRLKHDHRHLFHNLQNITEAIMQHYARIYIHSSTKENKTLNGFSYATASNIITSFLEHDFTAFQKATNTQNATYFEPLMQQLRIRTPHNKQHFTDSIFNQSDLYFIEPVVVAIMVRR